MQCWYTLWNYIIICDCIRRNVYICVVNVKRFKDQKRKYVARSASSLFSLINHNRLCVLTADSCPRFRKFCGYIFCGRWYRQSSSDGISVLVPPTIRCVPIAQFWKLIVTGPKVITIIIINYNTSICLGMNSSMAYRCCIVCVLFVVYERFRLTASINLY